MISRVYLTPKNIPLLVRYVKASEEELRLSMVLDREAERISYYELELRNEKTL